MVLYFVSRHLGAKNWFDRKHIEHTAVDHLEISYIKSNDVVIGSLPVHFVAQICQIKARYFHIAMEVPQAHRRKELTAEDMERFDARLVEFVVKEISNRDIFDEQQR